MRMPQSCCSNVVDKVSLSGGDSCGEQEVGGNKKFSCGVSIMLF